MSLTKPSRLEAFFLPAAEGQRLCLLHTPVDGKVGGVVLHVHPFAEELNITRRMVALQASRLAEAGHAVLLIDLLGCGDSSGDFGDARWDLWLADLDIARAWLAQRFGLGVTLWGTRLGALLALDHALHAPVPPERLLFWQPVLNGSAYLTQFLRLRLVNDVLLDGNAKQSGTEAMRADLRAGQALEVGGYLLAPQLAEALDRAHADPLVPPPCPVIWFDVGADGRTTPAPVQRLVGGWRERGAAVNLTQVSGPAFWASHEAQGAFALLDATRAALAGAHADA